MIRYRNKEFNLTKFYKILKKSGISPFQRFAWPLPQKVDGEWIPGEWIEIDTNRRLVQCYWGLHATTAGSLLHWYNSVEENANIYELEFDGKVIIDSGVRAKPIGYKARLLRQFPNLTNKEMLQCQLFIVRQMIASDTIQEGKYQRMNKKILEAISGDINPDVLLQVRHELVYMNHRTEKRYYLYWWYKQILLNIGKNTMKIPSCGNDEIYFQISTFFAEFLETRGNKNDE